MQSLNNPPSTLPADQAIRQYANRPFSEPYSYSVPFDNLLNGTTQTATLQIQSDSDFELSALSVMCNNVNVGDSSNVYEGDHFTGIVLQIADGATQVPLSNIPVPITANLGTGSKQRILPQKRILERNSVWIFTVTNLYSTADGDMKKLVFTLDGEKFYRGFQS